ncbi:Lipopolysaccharide export system permease protein LptG [Candidatus Profftia lariciata]|uniref:LPS export ABC transporter permease LptG n=1 Tax=Candidatus Profftia lariciata TaxID=1987921 RepID=UPI001D01D683|nr:LPS export ABC transporter permease LptG [Candidatus Profftia lariciata]UDG81421.1 Lipopolysaccharide export system permease protein LptG [Candidatus Profftia lariciata]
MIKVLDRYIALNIFSTIIETLLILVALSGIIKFIDQLRKIGENDYSAISAGVYTLLSLPKDIEIFFPMSALLGALLSLGMLAQYNELIGMQSAGYTILQIVSSVMKITIPLVILTMVISEWIAPQGEQAARNYRAQKIYGSSLLSTQNGLWAKDGNNFIYIKHVTGKNNINGISIYSFDVNNHLQKLRYAQSAEFKEHQWHLFHVEEANLTNTNKITSSYTLNSTWQTNLTPDKIGVVAMDPDSLSISSLYNYIKYLKNSGQESARYQLNMWSKIFAPLSVTVMLLMVLSFIFGPLRHSSMSIRILIGIIFGFLFYVLHHVLGSLCLVYNMTPVMGALLPILLFLLISIYVLLKIY